MTKAHNTWRGNVVQIKIESIKTCRARIGTEKQTVPVIFSHCHPHQIVLTSLVLARRSLTVVRLHVNTPWWNDGLHTYAECMNRDTKTAVAMTSVQTTAPSELAQLRPHTRNTAMSLPNVFGINEQHKENMFLSFSLDGWSVRAVRWVKARFWRC